MTWTLDIPGRPLLTNAERKMDKYARARAVKAIRDMAHVLWRSGVNEGRYPRRLERITVLATPTATDGRWRCDLGAAMPSVKAVIDGLVDAGLLVDDSERHVVGLAFEPTQQTGRTGLRLTITEDTCVNK